jgi:hypothetical protein
MVGGWQFADHDRPALIKYFPNTGPWVRIPSPALDQTSEVVHGFRSFLLPHKDAGHYTAE